MYARRYLRLCISVLPGTHEAARPVRYSIKVRATCDTMGRRRNGLRDRDPFGHHLQPYDTFQRSVGLIKWHESNGFQTRAVSIRRPRAGFGSSGINIPRFGIGGPDGNTPLRKRGFQYAQLRGTLDGMDTRWLRILPNATRKKSATGFRPGLRLSVPISMSREPASTPTDF